MQQVTGVVTSVLFNYFLSVNQRLQHWFMWGVSVQMLTSGKALCQAIVVVLLSSAIIQVRIECSAHFVCLCPITSAQTQ